jgi:peptidoglycan/xylan/chitin deacetylase (PgdA/CDA1 family)
MLVLNFHAVGTPPRPLDAGERDVCVERGRFLGILDAVRARPDVRLTFDDGNRSDVDAALPALADRELHAEFFVCAGRLGMPGFLDADDLQALRSAGMSIGLHGMDHVPWRNLSRTELDREIVEAKSALEAALGEPVTTAACPFGAYDRRSLRALGAAGLERIFTSDTGWARADDRLVARNTLHRWDSADSVERMLTGRVATSFPHKAKIWVKRWR